MHAELTQCDLDAMVAEELPARHEMALLNVGILVPINLGAALNVLTVDSTAIAWAEQFAGLTQQ